MVLIPPWVILSHEPKPKYLRKIKQDFLRPIGTYWNYFSDPDFNFTYKQCLAFQCTFPAIKKFINMYNLFICPLHRNPDFD